MAQVSRPFALLASFFNAISNVKGLILGEFARGLALQIE